VPTGVVLSMAASVNNATTALNNLPSAVAGGAVAAGWGFMDEGIQTLSFLNRVLMANQLGGAMQSLGVKMPIDWLADAVRAPESIQNSVWYVAGKRLFTLASFAAPFLGGASAATAEAGAVELGGDATELGIGEELGCPGGVCEGTCFVSGTLVATGHGEEPIERLHVGDRVTTDNSACDLDTLPSDAVMISLVIDGEHTIHATVVRPSHWLFDQQFNAGRFWIDIPEVGTGWARVVSLGAAPRDAGGSGCLVLATVDHVSESVLKLRLSDGDTLELTPTHPLYVEGTGWTVAGALHVGDTLRARTSDVVLRGIDRASRAPVFNIEVDREHSYRVGKSGVWAHNTCPPYSNGTPSPALEGSPYNPEVVESRVRPPYQSNPAHNPLATHGSFRTPEPADAADVYQSAVRGGMGTWWGRGAGGWYRYFSDNAGAVHFSGILSEDMVPIEIRRGL
jgi:hypothetical protein